jgi:hypothetical protein
MGWILSLIQAAVDWAMKLFGYVKEEKKSKEAEEIESLAWRLRNYATSERTKQHGNEVHLSSEQLVGQLGDRAHLFRKVIQYGEREGWITKSSYGDRWVIR